MGLRVLKKTPALILSVIMVLAMMPMMPGGMQEAYAATTLTPGSTTTLSNDTVYAIEEDGTYTFSGSSSSNQGGIAVKDGVHAVIILNDVSITNCFNPLYISDTAGTVVDLVLVGTNTFEGANRHFNSYNEKKDNSNPYSGGSAGIYVPESAVLNISGSGSLTASGGRGTGCYYGSGGGAGIGTNGSYHYSLDRSFASKCGTINIFSGNITANGNKGQDLSVSYGAAGIGGGGGSGSDRDLIDFGASDGGTITVYGGTVTAAGSEGGEGIGHGAQYSGNRRDLSSGTLAVSGSATVTSNGTPVSQSETVSAPTVSPQEVFFHDTAPDYTVASSAGTASPSFQYYKKNTVTIGGETITYYEQVSQKPDQIGKYCVCEMPDNKTKLPLLAEFEIKSGYRINYHLNGGTNASSNPSGYTIESDDITLADPVREGYTFAGWYDNAACTGTAVTKIAKGSTGDKDLYAKWTIASGTPLVNLSVRGAGKTASRLTWSKVKGASGYDIYYARCGWHSKLKRIRSQKGTTYTKTRLRRGASYKYYVRAYKVVNGKKKYISNSLICHSIAGVYNSRYTDARKLTPRKAAVTLKKGKSTVVSARTTKYRPGRSLLPKSHTIYYRFMSSNTNVAKVAGQGKVTAKNPGTCWIYIYAQNGVRTAVKITVK